MKALVYRGKEHVLIEERDIPTLKKEEVLVKVSHTGICGSDLGIYSGQHPRAKAPLIMGHEISGTIAETYGNSQVSIGERVVVNPLISCGICQPCRAGNEHVCETLRLIGFDCDGGFAEYVKVAESQIVRIPDTLSLEKASLAEPLAVAVHSIRKSSFKFMDSVVILGGGPIGLLIGMAAKIAGAKNILFSEINQQRIDFIKQLGFTVLEPTKSLEDQVRQMNTGLLADVVFEVAGVEDTALKSTTIVKNTGQIVIVSVFKQPTKIDLQSINFKEISMIGVRVYSREDFLMAVNMLDRDIEDQFSKMITHQISLTDGCEGFKLMNEASDAIKILIKP